MSDNTEYCFEFQTTAAPPRGKKKGMPAPETIRHSTNQDEIGWTFEGCFDRSNDLNAMCDRRRSEGLRGFFVRAKTEDEAWQRIEKISTPPETFYIL